MIPRQVAAAVLLCGEGYLIQRRPPGTPLAGKWETPGGKSEPGESLLDTLDREMREELDVSVKVRRELFAATTVHKHGVFEVHFFSCSFGDWQQPKPVEGQDIRVILPRDLVDSGAYEFVGLDRCAIVLDALERGLIR